jgi:WD40 repeat protein
VRPRTNGMKSALPFGGLLILLLPAVTPAADKPELILQTGSSSPPAALVFAPDGRLFASMDAGSIQLWDWASGNQLRTLNIDPRTDIKAQGAPSFVFTSGGTRIASVYAAIVKMWDVQTGRELGSVALAGDPVGATILSPDGRWTATFNEVGRTIQIRSAQTGRNLLTITPPGEPIQKQVQGRVGPAGPGMLAAAPFFHAAAFSADGSRLATWERALFYPSSSSAVRIWDVATGLEQQHIEVVEKGVSSSSGAMVMLDRALAFSPDGRRLAMLVRDETSTTAAAANADRSKTIEAIRGKANLSSVLTAYNRQTRESRVLVWELASGRQLVSWSNSSEVPLGWLDHLPAARALSFSANSATLAAAISDNVVKWFDVAAGREGDSWKTQAGAVSLAVDAVGRLIAVGGSDNSIALNELQTGRPVRSFGGRVVPVVDLAFGSDGRTISAGAFKAATLWDLDTGVNRRSIALSDAYGRQVFRGAGGRTQGGFFSADGGLLAAGSNTSASVKLWNVKTGGEVTTVALSALKELGAGAFSPDGKLLAVIEQYGSDQAARAAQTQEAMGRIQAQRDAVRKATRSRKAATQQQAKTAPSSLASPEHIRLIEVATGREVRALLGDADFGLHALAFSRDGRLLAAASGGRTHQIQLWDVASGNKLPSLSEKSNGAVMQMTFSPDGHTLAASHLEVGVTGASKDVSYVDTVRLWDVDSAKQIRVLPSGGAIVMALAFSRDGKTLASGGTGGVITLCETQTGRELRTLTGHSGLVRAIAFSPDGRLLASAAEDGSSRVWDAQTGEPLATLLSLNQGADWLAVTPEGLFDGSPAAWSQILWRFSESTFDVAPAESFFNEFFYPGLLAEVAAGRRPKPALTIAQKDRRPPRLALSLAGPGSTTSTRTASVRITIAEAPAGAQDVRLFRNGSLVKVWRGDVLNGQATATLEASIPFVAGENRLTAYAFNRDNIKSLDSTLVVQGADALKRRGTAYVLTIGIDHYENSNYDLKYAVADARAFADEVKRQQEKLANYERVEVIALLNEQATKDGILGAFERLIKTVQPEDVAIVYYAGHGTAYQSRFYLIPHDLGYQGERKALKQAGFESILQHGISDIDLERMFERIDVTRPILVIDACNSGQALEAEEKRRGPMNSKGLAQLAYEKGMYILTAAQSYQAALEAEKLGHGYLTYALVEEGLKKNAADFEPRDGVVLAREWLDYAAVRVPEMQAQEMRDRRDLVIAFVEGEEKIADINKRSVQRPRVFYRRELEDQPLIVAKQSP